MKPLPETPLVSLIVPTLNRAPLLREAIESVLAQTWPQVELLVLDGGSVDQTPAVLTEYAAAYPDRVRPSLHPGLGQLEKVNLGFAAARGELLMSFGDDDLLDPRALSMLVQGFREHPDAVVVYPDYHHIELDGTVTHTTRYPAFNLVDAVRLHICAPAFALFRKSLFEQIGGWDPGLGTVADWDYWRRASAVGEIHHVFEPLASLRVHPGTQSSRRSVEMALEQIRLVDAFYSRPDVPAELLAVRPQAYRNALIMAAILTCESLNGMDERFLVEDTMTFVDRTIRYEPAAESSDPWNSNLRLAAVTRRLMRALEINAQEIASLRAGIETRDAAIATLRESIAARDDLLAQAGIDTLP